MQYHTVKCGKEKKRRSFYLSLSSSRAVRLHYIGRRRFSLTCWSIHAALHHTSQKPCLCYLMHNLVSNLTVFSLVCCACSFTVSRTHAACTESYFDMSADLLLIGNCEKSLSHQHHSRSLAKVLCCKIK